MKLLQPGLSNFFHTLNKNLPWPLSYIFVSDFSLDFSEREPKNNCKQFLIIVFINLTAAQSFISHIKKHKQKKILSSLTKESFTTCYIPTLASTKKFPKKARIKNFHEVPRGSGDTFNSFWLPAISTGNSSKHACSPAVNTPCIPLRNC